MRGAVPPLPQYAFIAWCSVRKRTGTLLLWQRYGRARTCMVMYHSETCIIRRPGIGYRSYLKRVLAGRNPTWEQTVQEANQWEPDMKVVGRWCWPHIFTHFQDYEYVDIYLHAPHMYVHGAILKTTGVSNDTKHEISFPVTSLSDAANSKLSLPIICLPLTL
jgi:hypothetical protein